MLRERHDLIRKNLVKRLASSNWLRVYSLNFRIVLLQDTQIASIGRHVRNLDFDLLRRQVRASRSSVNHHLPPLHGGAPLKRLDLFGFFHPNMHIVLLFQLPANNLAKSREVRFGQILGNSKIEILAISGRPIA